MRDVILLWRIRAREWRSQLLYVFRVLGIDDTRMDWATYSYGFYIIGLAAVWGIVSWSMMLDVISQIGHAFPGTVIHSVSVILTVIAIIFLMRGLFSYPFLLPHGDLELMAPTPISRRAMATMALIPRQSKSLLIWGFIGSLSLRFFHLTHVPLWYGASAFALWGLILNVWVYTLSLWRVARSRKPRRFLGFLPLLIIPALFWAPQLPTWPAHWVLLAVTHHPSPVKNFTRMFDLSAPPICPIHNWSKICDNAPGCVAAGHGDRSPIGRSPNGNSGVSYWEPGAPRAKDSCLWKRRCSYDPELF